jgi:uncharacterized repeat protein (TIGR01451 family)
MPGPNNYLTQSAYLEAFDPANMIQNTVTVPYNQSVLCAYDPNDKAATPEGTGAEHYTLIGDWIEYLIRFQNTGNDTAFNVNVYDQLDEYLDWTTLEILESSHSMQTTMDSSGQVRFFFPNILLPDSNVNEPGSNGFVRYRIRHDNNIVDNTVIENTAYIVFDLNPAIVTNTTMNTMVTQLPVWIDGPQQNNGAVLVYPNPFREFARFKFENSDGSALYFELSDITGRTVRSERISGQELTLKKNDLPPGMYTYRFLKKDRTELYSGKLIVD